MKPTKEDPRTAAELLAGREGKVYTRADRAAAGEAAAALWLGKAPAVPPVVVPPPVEAAAAPPVEAPAAAAVEAAAAPAAPRGRNPFALARATFVAQKAADLAKLREAAAAAAVEAAAAPAKRWDRVTRWTPPTERPPPPSWLLWDGAPGSKGARGVFARGKVGLLSARGGTGKTSALCGLALALTSGRPWLAVSGASARPGDVPGFGVDPAAQSQLVALLLCEEDADEINRRLWGAATLLGLDPRKDLAALGLVVAPLAGATVALVTPGEHPAPAVEDLVERLVELADGREYAAVLLDPLSRFGGPEAETDNHAATVAITALERLTTLPGRPAVLVAVHERKGGQGVGQGADAVRGSSALVDGARWVARMEAVTVPGEHGAKRFRLRTGDTMARFTVDKSNYAAFPDERLLTVTADGVRAARADEVAEYRETLAERKERTAERAAERKASKAGGTGRPAAAEV